MFSHRLLLSKNGEVIKLYSVLFFMLIMDKRGELIKDFPFSLFSFHCSEGNVLSIFIHASCIFRECFRTSGCSWCTSSNEGYLVNGFCDLKEICPSQQCIKDGIKLTYFCR